MAMQQVLIGIFIGCILFYGIIYLLRVILGPGDDFMGKFGKSWAWNIFQPESVDLEVCKKAGVMTSSNCIDYVTCPTKDLATDCPAAGYIKPAGTLDSGTMAYTDPEEHKDELAYLSIYNANTNTRLLNLSVEELALYEAGLLGLSAEALKMKKIPANTELNTCDKVKTYLEGAMNTTLTNQEVADLTTVCEMGTNDNLQLVTGTTITPDGTSTIGELLLNDLNMIPQSA